MLWASQATASQGHGLVICKNVKVSNTRQAVWPGLAMICTFNCMLIQRRYDNSAHLEGSNADPRVLQRTT